MPPQCVLMAWMMWLITAGALGRADLPPDMVATGKQATVLVEADGGKRSGSAFCIDRTGFFITNEHVSGPTGGKLSLVLRPGENDQKVLTARVVRVDKVADIALLKAENPPPLMPLELGDTHGLTETQTVTAFGYPFGKELAIGAAAYPSITVSTGRITSLRKSGRELQEIQVDASLNQGNSGGPVINDKGQVIGVVVRGISGSGVNFAIPVDHVRRMLSQVEIIFAPPTISQSDQHEAHAFTIQVAQFYRPVSGTTIELILSTNDGPPRIFAAKSADGRLFKISAIPVPPATGRRLLRLTIKNPDSEIQCGVKDQPVTVGGKAINLSQIQRITRGAKTNVTLAGGQVLSGIVSGFGTVVTELGGKPVTLDLQQATDIAIEGTDLPVRAVAYQIVARQRGNVVGTETGQIGIAGAAEASAQSRPALELFVCSFETSEIKRYDGKNGTFLNDFATGNGIGHPHNAAFGRDGNLYVTSESGSVLRFSGKSGQFIDKFASGNGLGNATGLAIGPDGNLYVGNAYANSVKRFDGRTGTYLGDFVPPGSGGLDVCGNLAFGPDGNLYVCSLHSHQVKRYDGRTGAFLSDFAGGNGLQTPGQVVFGRDGNLYVTSADSHEVKRFDGRTGAFLDNFVSSGSGGLLRPDGMTFGPDGDLYVTDSGLQCVKRFNGRSGAYIDDFIAKASGGLNGAAGLVFRSTRGRP